MNSRVVGGVLVIATMLGGCAAPGPEQSDAPTRARSLWAARTDFVGDNSRVVTLAQEAGFGPEGSFSLSLQTEQEPYGLTVTFGSLGKPFDNVDFSPNATLLLGLVGNLGAVSVASGNQTYSLTASDASTVLGFDVKELGRDESRLADYVDRTSD